MTAADRLAQIRARVEAATPGPWGWARVNHWSEWTDRSLAGVDLHPGGVQRPHEVLRATPGNPPGPADAAFIAHARADIPALLAAVEAVLALHAPREQAVLSDPDCLREECDHDFACPLTGSVTVCAACWAVAEGSNPYFCEEGVPDEVLHPCPTRRTIEGPLS